MCVQTMAQVADITVQWELAKRIVGASKGPQQAVKALFDGIMQPIEIIAKTPVSKEIKERVWQQISPPRIKTLEDQIALEFCDEVLKDFQDAENSKYAGDA